MNNQLYTKTALWLFLFLFQVAASAQTTCHLSGKVSDEQGEPLSMALVAIENTTTGTYTNDKGYYELKLAAGNHQLVVSAFGYSTQKIDLSLTTNRKIDFTLSEQSVALESVEIYGKSQTQQVKESAFNVNALDVAPLAGRLSAISTAINRTTGIKIREEGGTGSDFELSINGMSGNSVRYFIDGMPMDTKGSTSTLANLPISTIERVEIYKGVVPAHLGSDALGGAVNIITRQARKSFLDVSYGIGSFHTQKFDLNAQYVTPQQIIIKPALALNYSKNDYMMKGVELWDETDRVFKEVNRRRFHDDYFHLTGQLEVGVVNRRWADAFAVQASYTKTDKELQTGAIQNIVYGDAKRKQHAWNINAQYRKTNFMIEKLDFNASLSYTFDHALTIDTAYRKYWWDGTYIESSRNEITGRGKSIRHYKRPLFIARGNLNYTLNEHHSFNLNYLMNRTGNERYDKVDTDFEPSKDVLAKHILGFSYNQSLLDNRWQNTFFVKEYINHLDVRQKDLYWITGAIDETGSSTDQYTGYGAGSRFSIFRELSVKASFEHSVRLPLVRELLGNGTTIYPNFKLKPESSDNWNAGLFGTLNLARGHLLYYEVNGFYRHVKDYIHTVISQAEGMSQYENVSNVDVKGLEGELRYNRSSRFEATINCSYQDSRSKTKYYANGSPMITYNNKIPNRPWLFGNFSLQYNQPGLITSHGVSRIGYNYEYVHWFFLTWEGYGNLESKSRIPTQHIHNLFIGQSFQNDRFNISIECNNLFDSKVYDNFMLQKPGRSFFCKFRFLLNS